MEFENTFSDLRGKKVSLTPEELHYFRLLTKMTLDTLGVEIPVTNRDHETLPSKHTEALGCFYTSDPKDPAADRFITLDNYFIHERYSEDVLDRWTIEDQSLTDVLCHELAHAEKFRHGKGHEALTRQYRQTLVNDPAYTAKAIILNAAFRVREALTQKYGRGTDLCGHCIEAAEILAEKIKTRAGIDTEIKEGWCRFDDEHYGSDRPWDPHTWIEVPSLGLYVDVTAEQFNPGMYPENDFPPVVLQTGLPQSMSYNEPSWEEFAPQPTVSCLTDVLSRAQNTVTHSGRHKNSPEKSQER